VSKIELAPAVAAAFPTMLDYIYFPFVLHPGKKDIELSTSNAVPLRVLSKYFGIHGLRKLVNSFINADLSEETCIQYMCNAEECNNVQLISVATEVSAKHFGRIESITCLSLTPERLQRIVNAESFNAGTD